VDEEERAERAERERGPVSSSADKPEWAAAASLDEAFRMKEADEADEAAEAPAS
jgi:hypothetical protein